MKDDPKPSDFVWQCEDAVYELSAKSYFIICRGKGHISVEGNDDKEVHKFAIYSGSDGGSATSETSFAMNEFIIKNRAKILVFKNEGKDKDEAQYFNIISDSFIENGVDEPIEMKLRVFTSLSFLTDDNGEYTIYDKEQVIKNPREFFNFKNKLLLVSQRTDSGDKLCFTEIEYEFSSRRHESKFEVGSTFHCTDLTKGYVGMGFGAHVTLWNPEEKYFTVNSVKLDFNVKKNWILVDSFNRYDLSSIDPAPKGGVREIDFSPRGAVIKFSTGKGVNDADKNVYAFSNYDLSQDKFFFKPEATETGNIINSFFVKFTAKEASVFSLEQPYLSVDTTKMNPGTT